MKHLEPFHSKHCNVAFAVALFLPDIATFVSASGFWSLVFAIITWIAIGVLTADSVLAWTLFRPEARTSVDLNVMLICEIIGLSLLALHALTITGTDGEANWFIGARWFRSAQLPLLRIAGRRAVLDTKTFREKVLKIIQFFSCKRSNSVAPANIIPIDYSPPVWSMYHESAQFAGLALVIMASMLTMSLSVTAVEPVIRARRSSLIQLAGCNSLAASLGSGGTSVYNSIARTLKDESHLWSIPPNKPGWEVSNQWGSILPTVFRVDSDDGSSWSTHLSEGYKSFADNGRKSSLINLEVGRCSIELSARSSHRFVALLDALTSIVVIFVVHMVVWGLVPGAPPSPEHDRDPLLGPLRRTWLRFYMVPELHSSLHTVTDPKHTPLGGAVVSSVDPWDLAAKDTSAIVATLKKSASTSSSTLGSNQSDNVSGLVAKRASWVSRTIPVGEKKLIREVAAMARGLIGLNVSLDAIDDETGGIFGRITKNTMFGTEDQAVGGNEATSSAGGLDEQTQWLLEGFTRADRDDFGYDGPNSDSLRDSDENDTTVGQNPTVLELLPEEVAQSVVLQKDPSIQSSGLVKDSEIDSHPVTSSSKVTPMRRGSSDSSMKVEKTTQGTSEKKQPSRSGSISLTTLGEKVATAANAASEMASPPLRKSLSLLGRMNKTPSQVEQDIDEAILSTEEEEKAAELQAYRNAFDLLDTDLSGALSVDELEDAMTALGKAPPSKEVLTALVTAADTDGNGEIDFDEFVSMMQQFGDAEDSSGGGGSGGPKKAQSFMEGGQGMFGSRDSLSLELIDRVMGAFKEQAVRMLKHQAYGGPAMVAPGLAPPAPSELSLCFFPPLPSSELTTDATSEDVDEDLQALSAAATAYGAPGVSPGMNPVGADLPLGIPMLAKGKSTRDTSITEDITEEEIYDSALGHAQASELAFQILMANGALEVLNLGEHSTPLRVFVDAMAAAYGDSTTLSNNRHAMESEDKIGAVGEQGGFGKKASNTKAYSKRGDGGAPFHGWHRAVDVALTIHHLLHAMEAYLHPNDYNNANNAGAANSSFKQDNSPGAEASIPETHTETPSAHSSRVSALFHGVSEKLYLTGKGNAKAIRIMNGAEKLALLLAALAHGLGHDGLSTSYHVQMNTPVAMFYNDKSPNENRSLAILFELLGTPPSMSNNNSGQPHPSPMPSQASPSFTTTSFPSTPVMPGGSVVSKMDPKTYRILRKSIVRNLLQSSMGHHATRVSSLRLFAFEHGAKPPPAAAAAKAAAASKGEKNSDLGAMSPQAAAFAAASAAKRSCDLLRASFGPNAPKDKRDKARLLIQQTVFHAGLLCTCACRSRNHAMYKTWVTRQHREWWKQAKLEQSHNLNKTTPFVIAAATPDSEGPSQKDVAEIEMGLFEQVILPFLVPLFDLFPPTRFLAKPLAENHLMIASERRRELSAEYRKAERRLHFANTVTERLIGVSRAPRRNTGNAFRTERESVESAADTSVPVSTSSSNSTSGNERSLARERTDSKPLETKSDNEEAGDGETTNLVASGKKSLLRGNSANWLRGATKKLADEGVVGGGGGSDTGAAGSSSSTAAASSGGENAAPVKKSTAASNWAVSLRWAAERADKIVSERAAAEETSPAVVWPSMTELRTSSMAAAAAAKANQLAVQKARLHLEARAAAFTETLQPYVKKDK